MRALSPIPARRALSCPMKRVPDYTGEPIADTETVGGHIYASQLPALPRTERQGVPRLVDERQPGCRQTHRYGERRPGSGRKYHPVRGLGQRRTRRFPSRPKASAGFRWASTSPIRLTIKAPGGAATSVNGQITGALSQAFDFASAQEGEYTVTVTASGKTTTAYYTNKALARVSLFSVDRLHPRLQRGRRRRILPRQLRMRHGRPYARFRPHGIPIHTTSPIAT